MATTTSEKFIDKTLKLSLEFNTYITRHPTAYKKIPRGATVVLTVKGDEKFNERSRAIAKKVHRAIEARKEGNVWTILAPRFFGNPKQAALENKLRDISK